MGVSDSTPRIDAAMDEAMVQWKSGDLHQSLIEASCGKLYELACEMERELAGFCKQLGDDNPVSAMVNLMQLERELADAKKDTARLDWIRRNCEIHWDMGASTQIMETLSAIDKAMETDK